MQIFQTRKTFPQKKNHGFYSWRDGHLSVVLIASVNSPDSLYDVCRYLLSPHRDYLRLSWKVSLSPINRIFLRVAEVFGDEADSLGTEILGVSALATYINFFYQGHQGH